MGQGGQGRASSLHSEAVHFPLNMKKPSLLAFSGLPSFSTSGVGGA